jgi:hypothetical protein
MELSSNVPEAKLARNFMIYTSIPMLSKMRQGREERPLKLIPFHCASKAAGAGSKARDDELPSSPDFSFSTERAHIVIVLDRTDLVRQLSSSIGASRFELLGIFHGIIAGAIAQSYGPLILFWAI